MITLGVLCGPLVAFTASPALASPTSWCESNFTSEQPANWLSELQSTASFGTNPTKYPYMKTWSNNLLSIDISWIACFESDYHLTVTNGDHYGEYQVTGENIQSYLGPIDGESQSYNVNCYMYGCLGLANWYYQDWIAMRYIKDRYGDPGTAWAHEVNYNWYAPVKPAPRHPHK